MVSGSSGAVRAQAQTYGSNDSTGDRVVRGTSVDSERAEATLSRVTVLHGAHCEGM